MPYIRLDQIEVSIGTHVLLDKVNLTLDKGDRLGLLGPVIPRDHLYRA